MPTLDLGWRNVVFSLRLASAAILALAVAYWLDISDPQWATLTVYILAQPTVGAALSKATWRAIGTVCGGVLGLVVVAFFSQDAELLVAVMTLIVAISFYAGARLRNFTSYGILLAGYTALLVGYEGSADPVNAWSLAVDRIGAILLGIGAGALTSTVILPRYAGDALRESLVRTFRGLASYVATALRLSTSLAVFAGLRARMAAEVVSFDALRSAALFEAPEMRASGPQLQRIVREFLMVLSVGRGVFVRLDAFEGEEARAVAQKFRPALKAVAAQVERIGADPRVWREPAHLRGELRASQRELRNAAAGLEDMAGTADFDPIANGLLVLRRAGDLLHRLAMVVVAEAVTLRGQKTGTPIRAEPEFYATESRREALWLAVRSGVAMLVLSMLWVATGWDQGFTAVSGGAIMLFFAVNQDNPQAAARSYFVWTAAGILLAYLAMVFVLPYLEGYAALSVVLLLLLLPAGLMAGTPNHAFGGIAFGGFTIAQLSTGNEFVPDELAYVNSGAAILLGMVVCLAIIAAMPVTSRSRRERCWSRTLGTLVPAAARGAMPPRRAVDEVVGMLAALLPRLSLGDERDERDEVFFRGTLGAASSAIELSRLTDLKANPDMPADAALAIERFLPAFADALEGIAGAPTNAERLLRLATAESVVADLRTNLSARPLVPGPAASALLHAGACLRFIADRFDIDRAYFERGFDES